MYAVVFKTPGTLDLRSITTFGVNSKPSTNSPIGFFGTGLKYAIAVLLRFDQKITIHTHNAVWKFEATKGSFRNKDFEFISMKRATGLLNKERQLPFTTELGRHWQLWQAYRELESNTRDENGSTYQDALLHGGLNFQNSKSDPYTYIVIEGNAFDKEYNNRNEHFLPQNITNLVDPTDKLQVIRTPSRYVYYRGMRVLDLEKPAQYTYNILQKIDLTEDRTAKYTFEVEGIIREHVLNSRDSELIKETITAPEGSYEHRIDFKSAWTPSIPSRTFIQTVRSIPSTAIHNTTVNDLIKKHDPQTPQDKPKHWLNQFIDALRNRDWTETRRIEIEYCREMVIYLGTLPNPDED